MKKIYQNQLNEEKENTLIKVHKLENLYDNLFCTISESSFNISSSKITYNSSISFFSFTNLSCSSLGKIILFNSSILSSITFIIVLIVLYLVFKPKQRNTEDKGSVEVIS